MRLFRTFRQLNDSGHKKPYNASAAIESADLPASLVEQGWRERLGKLSNLFDHSELKILDVGARGGSMPGMPLLAPFAEYWACEPDPEAAEQLETTVLSAEGWRKAHVFREALGGEERAVTLFITRQPGLSSVLEPDLDLARKYGFDDAFKVDRKIKVQVTTLHRASQKYGFEELGFIKLDTQGSELDILKSGETLLRGPVQGVFIELEFKPFYKSQPLFSEVESFLRAKGFELITIYPCFRRRTGAGLKEYSQREIVWAHCLFLKQVANADDCGERTALKRNLQQIAIALAFEQFDLAGERLSSRQVMEQLKAAGFDCGIGDLRRYVRLSMEEALYKNFHEKWKGEEKGRPFLPTLGLK